MVPRTGIYAELEGRHMRCPRCNFEGEPIDGGCARCGYGRGRLSSSSSALLNREVVVASPIGVVVRPLVRGDTLRQGRYQVIEQLALPKNQQGHGKAWLVTDAQSLNRLVMIREITPPPGGATRIEREVRAIAQRLAELGQHPGFPHLIDMFSERGNYYIVLQHVEGKSIAQLVQQGGVLPERAVAEYGRQLSEILNVLATQQQPLVHGAINPDNVIISPDGRQVTLIHFPLLPPEAPQEIRGKTVSGYLAPEQINGIIETRGDLYGAAATLYHALTGYDPALHMAFFYPPARRLNPRISQRMEAILTRGLRLSADQRYGRPVDMLLDLETLIASYPKRGVAPAPLQQGSRSPVRPTGSSRSTMVLFGIVTILVFALLFGGILFATSRSPVAVTPDLGATATANAMQTVTAMQAQQAEAASRAELALETQAMKQGIGVSDGRFVFDTYAGRNDVTLKEQAAQAIQASNMDTATSALSKAVSLDPTDGEAQIYNENLQIIQNGLPYITVVLGVGFDTRPAALAVERANMQAAFVAQYEINEFGLLSHNLQLRILIAGSGPDAASVEKAAQFVSNRVLTTDNLDHIIALVGWPSGVETLKARDIIAAAHIPMVTQTAADVNLAGSPYFYRVNAPYDAQGDALGTIAIQQLHAKNILVMRSPGDPSSVALANAFIAKVQALHGTTITNARDDFVTGTTSVEEYHTAIHDAVANNVDLIFMAGSDVDAVRLAHALGNATRQLPDNLALANLKILGGPAFATNLLLGQGNTLDARIAGSFPQDVQRLHFIALADSSEWKNVPANQQPTLFTEWAGLFQNSKVAAENAPPPDQNAIMTYDAVWVIGKAAAYVNGALTGQAVRDALSSLGTGSVPAYQGVGGRLSFDSLGNPANKAIVELDIVWNKKASAYQFNTIQVIGSFR